MQGFCPGCLRLLPEMRATTKMANLTKFCDVFLNEMWQCKGINKVWGFWRISSNLQNDQTYGMLALDIRACQVDGYDGLAEFGEIPLNSPNPQTNVNQISAQSCHVHIFDGFAEHLSNPLLPLYPFIEIMSEMSTFGKRPSNFVVFSQTWRFRFFLPLKTFAKVWTFSEISSNSPFR